MLREKQTVPVECACRCHAGGAFATCTVEGGCADGHGAEQETWHGALLEHERGLCESCTGRLRLALDELPDMMSRLSALNLPSMEVRYRTVDISGGGDPHPAIPLDGTYLLGDAMFRYADHEVTTWAELVADACGVAWDSQADRDSTPYARLRRGCQLLGYRAEQWVHLDTHEYLARSFTADPVDGHDVDTTTRYGRDYWCRRDGAAAAVDLIDLHHRAERAIAGPADHIPVPCGYCNNRTLRRDHFSGVVRCRTCGDTKTDDGYDAFLSAALAAVRQPAVA